MIESSNDTSRQLRAFLLGTLERTEREAIAEQLIADELLRERVDVELDRICDEYVRGTLPPRERERVAALARTALWTERLQFARALSTVISEERAVAVAETPHVANQAARTAHRWRVSRSAVRRAAVLLFATTGWAALAVNWRASTSRIGALTESLARESSALDAAQTARATGGVIDLALFPAARGSDDTPALRVASDGLTVRLRLVRERPWTRGRYFADIRRDRSSIAQTVVDVPSDSLDVLSVLIPTAQLPAGRYDAVVRRTTSPDESFSYSFEIRR
ncbi:MAG TPA: hypothetical protein VGM50_02435 [Gemmatimonadaceae bacterium]|jgi:hypothetical protein